MSNFKFQQDSLPPIVKNLVIINVLVFVAQLVFPNLTAILALYPVGTPYFRPYQIATHMFAHSPGLFFHILFNMLMLWMFGRMLENIWGPQRFLFFYLACGVGAAAFHLLVQYLTGSFGSAIGASGAVMGILVGFAYLFPNTELMVFPLPIPIKAKWLVLAYVLIDLYLGIANFENDNVAHFAHLGGAITGFIIVLIWNKGNRRRFY